MMRFSRRKILGLFGFGLAQVILGDLIEQDRPIAAETTSPVRSKYSAELYLQSCSQVMARPVLVFQPVDFTPIVRDAVKFPN